MAIREKFINEISKELKSGDMPGLTFLIDAKVITEKAMRYYLIKKEYLPLANEMGFGNAKDMLSRKYKISIRTVHSIVNMQ